MSTTGQLLSIARGEDLLEHLNEATRRTEGWVQATGAVDAVELRVAGEGADPTRALRGRLTLVSLMGPTGGPYAVTLARATDAGLEVLGGELLRARSDGVTAIVVGTAAAPERERAARPAEPSAPRAAAAPAQSAWASAALATAHATRAAEVPDDEPELPKPGDLVQHFAFGLCEVLMGDDERLKIRDVSGPGRIREIRLDMLVVREPSEKDGKRLFRLDRRS